jgi:hypothetical protein
MSGNNAFLCHGEHLKCQVSFQGNWNVALGKVRHDDYTHSPLAIFIGLMKLETSVLVGNMLVQLYIIVM